MTLHLSALGEVAIDPGTPSTLAFKVFPPPTVRTPVGSGSETFEWAFDGGVAPYIYYVFVDNGLAVTAEISSMAVRVARHTISTSIFQPSTLPVRVVVEDALGDTIEQTHDLTIVSSATEPTWDASITEYVERGGPVTTIDLKTKINEPDIDWTKLIIKSSSNFDVGGVNRTLTSPGEFIYDASAGNGILKVTGLLNGVKAQGTDIVYTYNSSGYQTNSNVLAVRTYNDPLTVSHGLNVPQRVQGGEAYTVMLFSNRASSFAIEKSINGSTGWTTIYTTETASPGQTFNSMTHDVFVSTGEPSYWMRGKATSGSETVYTTSNYITVEPIRITGNPTSSNAASSQHITFLPTLSVPAMSMSADLTIPYETTDKTLGFWALQCFFHNDAGTEIGAAHTGLQLVSGYPNNHAVNWGGYLTANGSELTGTVSALPSATNNPNTRNYDWVPGRKYQLNIFKSPTPDYWSASVFDTVTSNSTLIRNLYVPGATKLSTYIIVFSEQFTACNAESREAIWQNPRIGNLGQTIVNSPRDGFLTYQSYAEGGCTNTSTHLNAFGDGWIMKTNTNRANGSHHGVWLSLTA